MQAIRFVHAADLHLDTAFAGISREAPADLVRKLHESTFTAFARLIELCERERPDFLLLGGDIHNLEDRSVRAQLTLRDGCERLRQKGVRVFIAHGNHDPLSSRMHNIKWPENVTVFSDELSSVPVFQRKAGAGPGSGSGSGSGAGPGEGSGAESGLEEKPLALVHGISHATGREQRNLALRFKRSEDACLQIGLLHCSVSGIGGDKGRYAPCSLEDLKNAGLDYWALGHIHERREISTVPAIVYPGCAQGLHINEQGEKGCVLVTATANGPAGSAGSGGAGGYTLQISFRPLGPVIWRILEVPLDSVAELSCEKGEKGEKGDTEESSEALSLDALENRLRAALDAVADEQGPDCEALIVRLRLTGRTELDALLRRDASRADLLERLRDWEPGRVERGHGAGPRVWVKDLDVRTRSVLDRRILAEREDLVGEIVRLAEACRTSPQALAELRSGALAPLFGHSRMGKALEPLSDDAILALLDDAESLCLDLLEDE